MQYKAAWIETNAQAFRDCTVKQSGIVKHCHARAAYQIFGL